ncbi:MAG: PAS domain S-box protein [Alphaproteobacteria bacterium]|jgi:PAS domain S-box-containing protein|nr:PAS domain S-box protein [Alphaproteobacteria bacterium]MBT7943530.1 PAS domain S-box protein [Alphaproteobacteria bacterium]
MFKNAKFGLRITLYVSLLLLGLLFSGLAAFVYVESRGIKNDIKTEAGHILEVLESIHTQAMLNRGDKKDNNPVLNTLNGTVEQFNAASPKAKLWLVMGPKVLAFQKREGSQEVEPPRDDIDQEAIKTGKTVSRITGADTFRFTRPVILGQGVAANKKCLECHAKEMGMVRGEVIGAFSVALSVKERRDEFFQSSLMAFMAAIGVSVLVLIFNAGLLKHLAGAPITRLTWVMAKLAEGELETVVPSRGRHDEIGAMARALEVFRVNTIKLRLAEEALRKAHDELEQRVVERTRELEMSSQRQAAIFEHAAEGIITSDKMGLIETFNPTAEVLFGYKADEVIGQNLNILMAKGHAKKHDGYIDTYRKTGVGKILGVRERELMARRKDGTLFPFELNVAEFILGGEQKFIGTMRDIAIRRKAEEDAQVASEHQALLQAVAQGSNEARTVEVAMEACLGAVCELTGWPIGHAYVLSTDDPDILLPSGIWNLVASERFEEFCKVTNSMTFSKGEGLPGRVLGSGKPFWIADLVEDENFPRAGMAGSIGLKSGFAFPVLVRGKVEAVMEFFSDEAVAEDAQMLSTMSQIGTQIGQVIERNRALEQLAAAMEKTELANRAKTEFLANMSHELRTPLNSIIGFSEVVKNEVFGPIGNARYAGYLVDIHSSGKHLLELINDILDVSKVEAGAMDLIEEELDVEDVIWDAVRVVKGRADNGAIALSIEVDRAFPRLRADSTRVKQILLNLLSNALKFTPEGGSVCIGAEMEQDGRMAIAVTDTGIGISQHEQEKVLEPFIQASSGLARRHEGTGLGLYLVKALIEEHTGSVEITSRLDHGTTVTVYFPANRVIPKANEVNEAVEG